MSDYAMARWAQISVVAAAIHAGLFLALHVLEPELSPIVSIISDYAATDHATVATAAFVAFGLIWGCLAVALARASGSRSLLIGRVLFMLAMLAILAASVFPEAADPRTGSLFARIQNLIARPGLFLALILVSVGLRRLPGWERRGGALLGLAVLATFLLICTIAVLLPAGFGGLGQRAVFVVLYVWTVLLARRLASSAQETPVDA